MKKELKKIIYDKKIFIIFFFVIIAFFTLSTYYTINSKTQIVQNYSHTILVYRNEEQLDKRIEDKKKEILELDEIDSDYSEQKRMLSEDLAIYEYLKENHIKYEDGVEIAALAKNDNTRLKYYLFIEGYVVLLVLVIAVSLSYYVFVREIQDRESVFIYGNDFNKNKTLAKKILVYFLSIFLILIIFLLFTYILGLALPISRNTIVYFYQNHVISMSVNRYYIGMLMSLCYETLCIGLLFLAIGLSINKLYSFAILSIFIYGGLTLMSMSNNNILVSFTILPISIYNVDISQSTFIVIAVIRISIMIGLSILAFLRFNKKSLL